MLLSVRAESSPSSGSPSEGAGYGTTTDTNLLSERCYRIPLASGEKVVDSGNQIDEGKAAAGDGPEYHDRFFASPPPPPLATGRGLRRRIESRAPASRQVVLNSMHRRETSRERDFFRQACEKKCVACLRHYGWCRKRDEQARLRVRYLDTLIRDRSLNSGSGRVQWAQPFANGIQDGVRGGLATRPLQAAWAVKPDKLSYHG